MNSKSKWWENCSWEEDDGPRPINPTDYQIFVGGLGPAVDEPYVRDIFEREVGPVWDVMILRFRDGRSRGFGLVQFVSKKSVEKAMEIGEIQIDKNMVKLRLAVEKKQATSHAKLLFRRKVVLFGLNEQLDHQALTEYFKKYGQIEKVMIFDEAVEKSTCKPGYVQFEQEECVSAILADLQLPQICIINNQKLLIYSGQAKGTYVKAWRNYYQQNLLRSPRELSIMITAYAKSINEDGHDKPEPIQDQKLVDRTSTIKTSSQSNKEVEGQAVEVNKRTKNKSQLQYPPYLFHPAGLRFNISTLYGSKQTYLFYGF